MDVVWGELWVCRHAPDRSFTRADVDRLQLVSARLGDAMAPYVSCRER